MNKKIKIISLILLGLGLPTLLTAIKYSTDTRRQAAEIPANIVVYSKNVQGKFQNSMYQNFAQGGEAQHTNMFKNVSLHLRLLQPKRIRIDHVFDYYTPTELDDVVQTILFTGATPFFSLTGMENIPNWEESVKALVRRYTVDQNLFVTYEVGNEPDLFGGWKYKGEPNYLNLYHRTVDAIVEAAGNKPFEVGGPSTTGFYTAWINSLLNFCEKNDIRLDFISYHTYSTDITKFQNDTDTLSKIISEHPRYSDIKRYITETGPNSENTPTYNTKSSAIHFLALATVLSQRIHGYYTFEVVDGDSSNWGLLTKTAEPKPRFHAIQFLNNFTGDLLASTGNGSYVTALAAKENDILQILLVNYDPAEIHQETVPITINDLKPGKYSLNINFFDGETKQKIINIETNTLKDFIDMPPNSSALLNVEYRPL